MCKLFTYVRDTLYAEYLWCTSAMWPGRPSWHDATSNQWCRQDQILRTKTKTKTTGSKQMHLADLTFKYVNVTVSLLISAVVMFQVQNRETTNSTWKVAVSFKIIMTTNVTRSFFTKQYQTCKTKTKTKNTEYKTKTDFFLVSDWSCPTMDGLRPHHCQRLMSWQWRLEPGWQGDCKSSVLT